MQNFFVNFFVFMTENILWFVLVYMFHMGKQMNADWVKSVRSIVTALVVVLFIKLALTRLDPKDSMLIISLVFNFYFLAVKRNTDSGTLVTGIEERTWCVNQFHNLAGKWHPIDMYVKDRHEYADF